MSAESIGQTAFLGDWHGRETAKLAPPGAAGSTVGQNRSKALPRETVWRIRSWNRRAKTEIPVEHVNYMRATDVIVGLPSADELPSLKSVAEPWVDAHVGWNSFQASGQNERIDDG